MLSVIALFNLISQEICAAAMLQPGWSIQDVGIEWSGQIVLPNTKVVTIPLQKILLQGGPKTMDSVKDLLQEAKKKGGIGSIIFYPDTDKEHKGMVDWKSMTEQGKASTASALVMQPDAYGMTAIHYAAYLEYKYILQEMLSYCEPSQIEQIVNVCDKYGRTPLYWALNGSMSAMAGLMGSGSEKTAVNKKIESLGVAPVFMMQLLIENGANPIAQDNAGRTPLHWSALYLKPDISDFLIKTIIKTSKENLNIADYAGATPLHYLSAMRYVLSNEKIKSKSYQITAAALAGAGGVAVAGGVAQAGGIAVILQGATAQPALEILRVGELVQTVGELTEAQEIAEMALLKLDMVQNLMGSTVEYSHFRQVSQIEGVSQNLIDTIGAAARGDSAAAKLVPGLMQEEMAAQKLIFAGGTTLEESTLAAEAAASARMLSIAASVAFFVISTIAIELLMRYVIMPEIKHDAQQNARDKIHRQRDDMIRLLLGSGANIKAVDKNKKTALHYATSMGNYSVVKLLTSRDAGLAYATDIHGMLPAHLAALSGFEGGALDSLKLLFAIDAKAAHKVSADGLTPLLCAIDVGNYEIMPYLIGLSTNEELLPVSSSGETGISTPLHHLMMQLGSSVTAKHKHPADREQQLQREVSTMLVILQTLFEKKGLNKEALLKQKDNKGRTAFHYLAGNSKDYEDQVFYDLLKRSPGSTDAQKGAYLRDTIGIDLNGNNLLHLACAAGRELLVEALVKQYGFDLSTKTSDVKDGSGAVISKARTPLEIARDAGFPRIVNFIAKEAGLKKSDRKPMAQEAKAKETIINKAEKAERIEANMQKKVSKKTAKIDTLTEKKRWDEDERAQKLESATKMKKKNKKLASAQEALFIQAARAGNLKTIKATIHNTDLMLVDDEGKTALMHAAQNGHKAIVDLILDVAKKQKIEKELVEMTDNDDATAYDLTRNENIRNAIAKIIIE